MNLSTALGIIIGTLIVNGFFMLFHLNEINVKLEKIEKHLFKIQIHTLTIENQQDEHNKRIRKLEQ